MALIENVPGATPIDDISELIPTHITTRSELNEWEAANILKPVKIYLTEKRKFDIGIAWLKKLHKEMFDETWKWAGEFRKRNMSLGVDWHYINEQLKILVDDIDFWEKGSSGLNIFSRSIRLHHRLVKIHPFVNGNGRHARLASDIFLFNNNQILPTWPSKDLLEASDIRKKYIAALQEADKMNYKPLEIFTATLMGK